MSVTGGYLGYQSAWSSQMGAKEGYYVPDELKLNLPQNPVRVSKKLVKRDVDTAMPITPQNPIIRWKIPSNGNAIVDFKKAKVYITFSVGVNAPWSARPSALAWNIIERLRLEQGGQYVEDRRFFNLQESMVYTTQTHINQQVTTGVALYGDGSAAQRNARSGGWEYVLPFPTTCLTKAPLPWFAMSPEKRSTTALPDTFIQWELAKPEDFVEVFGGVGAVTGLTWTVTRMQIEYEELYPEGGPQAILSKWLSPSLFATRGGFPRIWFRSFLTNVYPLTTSTEQNIYIDMKLSSINTIFATFRYTANTSNPQIYSKHTTYISKADMNLIEYQWEINSCLWPDKPVSLVDPSWVEGYVKYLEAWGMYHSRGIQQEVTPITIDQFLNDKFLAVFDGVQFAFSPAMLNPVSTANSGSIIQLRIKFSIPPPAGIEVVIHNYHWKVLNFGSNGGAVPVVET